VDKRWRILMFAPAFAPQGNAEAITNGKLALAMLEAGWEVEVISREPPTKSPYEYGGGWTEPWHPLKPFVHVIATPAWSAGRRLLDLALTTIRMGHAVEGVRWASRAYDRGVRLHRKRPFDVVMSRAFPEAAHLPAMTMSRRFGLPWIANWNDPWVFLGQAHSDRRPLGGSEPRLGALAKAVAARASWHTFPCEGLRAAMCPLLGPAAAQRSSVVPHASLKRRDAGPGGLAREFLMTYVGRLWRSQNPEPVFAAFARLLETSGGKGPTKLRFVGISDYDLGALATKHGIGGDFVDLGRRTYRESLNAMEESAVLLLLDPAGFSDIVLTSKVSDYAYAGRPILAMTSEHSAISQLIGQHGGGVAVSPTSVEGITGALVAFFQAWVTGGLDQAYDSARLYGFFCPLAISKAYGGLFTQLSPRGGFLG
jgi:glycosyltransferase involved in cell wall biosynthesis